MTPITRVNWEIPGIEPTGITRGRYCEIIAERWILGRWPDVEIIQTQTGPHGIDFAVILPKTIDGKLIAIVEVKAPKSRLAKNGNSPSQMSNEWILDRIRRHAKLKEIAFSASYAFKEIIRVYPETKKIVLSKLTGQRVDLSEFKNIA